MGLPPAGLSTGADDEHGQTIPLTPESVGSARDTRPNRLGRTLVGDLDNIVLKALNKEPARRYPSVEQLSTPPRSRISPSAMLLAVTT